MIDSKPLREIVKILRDHKSISDLDKLRISLNLIDILLVQNEENKNEVIQQTVDGDK